MPSLMLEYASFMRMVAEARVTKQINSTGLDCMLLLLIYIYTKTYYK